MQVASITPAIATDPNGHHHAATYYIFTSYQTSNFSEPAGMHTIEFLGYGDDAATARPSSTTWRSPPGAPSAMAASRRRPWPVRAYQVAPTGTSWQFSGIAGVSANASAFTFGNPVAPDGYQVAFIKDTGSISQ